MPTLRHHHSAARHARTTALVAALVLPAAAAAQGGVRPAGFPPELDAYVARAMEQWEVPGLALAVVRNDSVLVARGYGVRRLGAPERVDENTVFNVASLTKSFTATAAAMLVDDGRLEWDAPATRYLPTLRFADPYLTANVTVRDLLAHRTGLHASNMAWQMADVTRADLLARARFLVPELPFRAGMVYSNVGYTIAGEAIAAAAGTTYEALIRSRILGPLGMRSSSVTAAEALAGRNVVSPHAVIGGVLRPIAWRDIDVIAPAGAVNSTASDMARWLRFQLADGVVDGRRLVSGEQLWQTHSPQNVIPVTPGMKRARLVEHWAAYALGWQVMDYRGHPLLWHTGSSDGQPSMMALLPDDRLGVVVMMNSGSAGVLHALLLNRIVDAYIGAPPRDWSGEALAQRAQIRNADADRRSALLATRVPGTRPSHPDSAYAGAYVDSLYGRMTVRAEGGRMTLRVGGEGPAAQVADLEHFHYDGFLVTWRDPLFGSQFGAIATFDDDAGGRPATLRMQLNRDAILARREAVR